MKKRIMSLLLVLVLLAAILPVGAMAADDPNDDTEWPVTGSVDPSTNLTWSLTQDGVLTISGRGSMPSWRSNNATPWFDYRSMITRVVIEEGATKIGSFAFGSKTTEDAYEKLVSISIPSSVTSIEGNAFLNSGLTGTLTIPATVYLTSAYHFQGTSIDTLIIEGNLEGGANMSFQNCEKLANVTINGVINGDGSRNVVSTFKNCTALTTLTVGGNVKQSKGNIVDGCTALNKILIKKTVTEFNGTVFSTAFSNEGFALEYEGSELDWNGVTVSNIGDQAVTFLGGTVTGLEVSGDYKKTYQVGEAFDTTGMTVAIGLSTGDKVEAPIEEVQFTGFDSSATGEITVTASYKGYSTTFTVKVVSFAEAKTTVKAANLKNGTIKLTWTAIDGAKQYKVLVATSKDGTYKLAGTVTGKSFTYTKGTVGKAYYFKVVGVNEAGTESAESKVVNKYRLPGQVGSLKVKSAKAKQVTLTWKKVTGAKKYFVYMSKNGKTGWKKIGTATKTTFTYKKGTSGKTLYFKVQAVSSSGKKGEFSAVKKCKVK